MGQFITWEKMFTFDDIIILPTGKAFPLNSRSDIVMYQKVRIPGKGWIKIFPIIPAPMAGFLNYQPYLEAVTQVFGYPDFSSIGDFQLTDPVYIPITIPRFPAEVMTENTQLKILHKYFDVYRNYMIFPFVAIGLDYNPKFVETLIKMAEEANRPVGVIVDVSNGYHIRTIETVKNLRKNYPNLFIMAGNIAEYNGYLVLRKAGADMVRAGIGGGRVCSTRLKSSTGASSPFAAWQIIKNLYVYGTEGERYRVVVDGGINRTSFIPIALWFGTPMIGSLLAKTDVNVAQFNSYEFQKFSSYNESPESSQIILPDDFFDTNFVINYEKFVSKIKSQVISFLNSGKFMTASVKVLSGSSLFSKTGPSKYPEGVVKVFRDRVDLRDLMEEIRHAITTAMSFVGATTLDEFHSESDLILTTHNEGKDRSFVDYSISGNGG